MSIERTIRRNDLKRTQRNNKIGEAFRKSQIYKYGIQRYFEILNENRQKKRTNKHGKVRIVRKGTKFTPRSM